MYSETHMYVFTICNFSFSKKHIRTYTLTNRQSITYILIWHVPVRPFSIRHYFPHNYSITPHIAGWCKFAVLDGLWSCPSHWDFSTLSKRRKEESFPFPPQNFCIIFYRRHLFLSTSKAALTSSTIVDRLKNFQRSLRKFRLLKHLDHRNLDTCVS